MATKVKLTILFVVRPQKVLDILINKTEYNLKIIGIIE